MLKVKLTYINNLTRNVKLLLILTTLWDFIPKRNWMAKHFGELFMLDDDVHACKPIYVEKGEPSRIKDKDKITNIIQSLFEMYQYDGCTSVWLHRSDIAGNV
ncbi:hypothetical protein NXX52_19725 [Bacteroides ovatus]|nr:hypothetical protein [Bacteroides ovatus]